MAETKPTIAVIGGTGALGSGLALRWARAGYPVVIGSRSRENAETKAAEIAQRIHRVRVQGRENRDAAEMADIVVLTVPYANQQPMLETIRDAVKGKILIDTTVPLIPPKVARVQLPEGGSAAKAAQAYLGDGVQVVSAFQNVAADRLQNETARVDCDILVCGNKRDAREQAIELVIAAGMKGWHAGPIDNSAAAEALTSVLIFINRSGATAHAGIRITDESDA